MPTNILIVDDEKDALYILGDVLKKEGYAVDTAGDGIEALEKIALNIPDLIILDLMMPRMDGHSVNMRLKSNPLTAKIPVIVITAYGQMKDLLEIKKELAVSAYLEKPFPVTSIIAKIKEVLENNKGK